MNIKKILIAITILFSLPATANKGFTIYGQLEKGRNDTLKFVAWPYLISQTKKNQLAKTTQSVALRDGKFYIHLDDRSAVFYFELNLHTRSLIGPPNSYYIAEPTDSIEVNYINGNYSFSGAGSAKYQYQYNAMDGYLALGKKYIVYAAPDSALYAENIRRMETGHLAFLHAQLEYLYTWKSSIPADIFITLKNNIVGRMGGVIYNEYQVWTSSNLEKAFVTTDSRRSQLLLISAVFATVLSDTLFSMELPYSNVVAKDYLRFLVWKDVFRVPAITIEEQAKLIAALPPSKWRDEEQTLFLIDQFDHMNGAEQVIKNISAGITNQNAKEALKSLIARISDKPAEDFVLTDTRNRKLKVSDYINKVVLLDFWFTGCDGCTDFYKNTLQALESDLSDTTKFAFISVCIDKDPLTWKKSIAKNIYTSEKAINVYTSGNKEYDPIIQHYKIIAYPTIVILDKTGHTRTISSKHNNAQTLAQMMKQLANQ